MRIHELAKEFNLTSKDLLAKLPELNITAKSHMSALKEEQIEQIRQAFSSAPPKPGSKKKPEPSTPAKPPKTTTTKTSATPTPPAPQAEVEAMAPHAPAATIVAPESEKAVVVAETAEIPAKPEPLTEKKPASTSPTTEEKTIEVRGPIIVRELAAQINMRPNQLVAELMSINVFASINNRIEMRVAQKIAEKHGFKLQHEKKIAEHKATIRSAGQIEEEPEEDKPEDLVPRPPVVTFLGHVDHGKTSLLDKVRSTRVVDSEQGGITQHIGAYTVEFKDQKITFIDTPGHEAFTAMRARGANLTDIAVIVVAAEEGIKPQTREAIQHARAAEVCIMVAINKIDLDRANVDQVKLQLQEEGLAPEDWGGDIICCPVSAMTGEGIDHLLEMILLQAEVMELKANAKRRAQGYIIEARLEQGMGPTANLLVKRGTLKVGDPLVCGPQWGKVKALINDLGKKVRTAGPSIAVKCLGLTSVPEAGAEFRVYSDARMAKETAEKRAQDKRLTDLGAPTRKVSLDDMFRETDSTEVKELPIVLKADVQGSLEALHHSLTNIKSDKIKLNILLSGVGNITDNDVLLASASNAIVLGFQVSKDGQASSMAKREGVEIRLYGVIYELLENVERAMTGLLAPALKENIFGHAEIRQIFDLSKKGKVAGCMVIDGRVYTKAKTRVTRNGDVMYEGRMVTLKRYQSEAAEVRDGQECGIRLENFTDFQVGDIIEFYEIQEVAQTL